MPSAKITKDDTFSIVSDYIGKPIAAYNGVGNLVWDVEYDIYGNIRSQSKGDKDFIPFRNQGQYEDSELNGLMYNRFRYYDGNSGTYISQDPVSLSSGEFNFYGYVRDSNIYLDVMGLMPFWKPLKGTGMGHHPLPRGHVNDKGLPKLGTKYDSPSWYPNVEEGSEILHQNAHDAIESKGVSFRGKFEGTLSDLISKVKSAYSTFPQLGYVKIPSTEEIIKSDVTLSEAVDIALEWNDINCKK